MKNDCFIDTNALIYLFDATSSLHKRTQKVLTKLIEEEAQLYLSHAVLEEFIFIQSKLASKTKDKNNYKKLLLEIETISKLPGIEIIEPSPDFSSAENVIKLLEKYTVDPNDAYILNLMLEHKV